MCEMIWATNILDKICREKFDQLRLEIYKLN